MTRKQIVQQHHISYKPEVTILVYKGEHMILTRLQWTKRAPSKGFVKALKIWLALHETDAVELEKENV